MRGKRWTLLFAACAAGTALLAYPASAVKVKWEDLTNAQQKAAYQSLESENESLRAQLKELQAQTAAGSSADNNGGASADGETSAGSAADSDDAAPADASDGNAESGADAQGTAGSGSGGGADSGSTAAGSGESAQTQRKDTATFLQDIGASFEKRQTEAGTCSADQIAQMSASDLWAYRFRCAEAERDFYEAYKGAQLESLNLQYLCDEYCAGLGKQYKAETAWKDTQDADKTSQLYSAGYYNRAYALVELHDYYSLELPDGYQDLKEAVDKMNAAAGAETRNASADSAAVKKVQELLNALGFLCGTPDGICGRQTVSCIERFQTMYGFEPADGLIDDELLGQMQEMLNRQGA